jgi:para-nitrobenzyl esterase
MVARPEIDAPIGRVRGAVTAAPVVAFRGIPYAVPPVAHRRFARTEQHGGWEGTHDAARSGPQAPQAASMLDTMAGMGAAAQSEDCLTLDVFTPDPGASLPVMVWIHGGGFLSGAGSVPWYDGTNLAKHGDVVVVTINYRLGALGFLHLADVEGSGIAGMLDQVTALRWVRDNISAFGGDASRVTVFGESAGAMSIATLMGMAEADGLVHQAVLQSGAARHLASIDDAVMARHALARRVGLEGGADVSAWRALAPERLVAAQAALLTEGGFGALPLVPVVDGRLLSHPLDRLARGEVPLLRMISGTTLDEMRLFTAFDPSVQHLDRAGVVRRCAALGAPDPAALLDAKLAARPGLSWADLWSAVSTDEVFRMPAEHLLDAAASGGISCFSYLFAWPTPAFGGRFGACHAVEIPFVFDNLTQPGISMLLGGGRELPLIAAAMSSAWRSFAGGRDPWDRYGGDRCTWTIDAAGRPAMVADPNGVDRAAWGPRWSERIRSVGKPWAGEGDHA